MRRPTQTAEAHIRAELAYMYLDKLAELEKKKQPQENSGGKEGLVWSSDHSLKHRSPWGRCFSATLLASIIKVEQEFDHTSPTELVVGSNSTTIASWDKVEGFVLTAFNCEHCFRNIAHNCVPGVYALDLKSLPQGGIFKINIRYGLAFEVQKVGPDTFYIVDTDD